MSYNIVGRPDSFTPVYNPIYYYLDSSNKSNDGFKYIVDLYSAGTTNRLSRYKLFPRPDDGYGVSDINQILATQVSSFFDQNLNGFAQCPQNFCNYTLNLGEEYVYNWPFQRLSGSSINGVWLVNTSGTIAEYNPGDEINITQQSNTPATGYTGVFNVITGFTLNGAYIVKIDRDFIATGNTSGSTTYSDLRKSQYLGLSGATGTTFNGVIGHQYFLNYTSSTYNMLTGTSSSFLTNMPSGFRVKTSNSMWWNIYSTNTGFNADTLLITTPYTICTFQNPYSASSDTMLTIGIGPDNLTNFSPTGLLIDGTFPIFKNNSYTFSGTSNIGGKLALLLTSTPIYTTADSANVTFDTNHTYDALYSFLGITGNTIKLNQTYVSGLTTGTIYQRTDYYDVDLQARNGNPFVAETLRVNINYDCFRFDNIELYFADRFGSYIPVNFELNSTRSLNIERGEYQTILGNLSNGKWGYNSTDRGRHSINTRVIQQLEIQTNWLTQAESTYLQELATSPLVYIKEFGQLWPVIVKDSNYLLLTKNNKKNIPLKMTIEYANNDRVNNFG